MSARRVFSRGVAANAAARAVGIAIGAGWVGIAGYSTNAIAIACLAMLTLTAMGEVIAWHVVPDKIRRIDSPARRWRRFGLTLATLATTLAMAAINDPAGLLAMPWAMRLERLMGTDPATLSKGTRFFISTCSGTVCALLFATIISKLYWRFASPAELARIGSGRTPIVMQDYIGIFGIPLLTIGAFTAGLDADGWAWQMLAVAFAFAVIPAVADAPLRLAALAPRRKREPSDDERRIQRKGMLLLGAGFLAASLLGEIVWRYLGKDIAATAAGLLTMTVTLAAISALYWRITRPWQSVEAGRPINRPEWVAQLFAISFFLYPLNWAKDMMLFKAKTIGEVLTSPRLALTVLLACASALIMLALSDWLKDIEARDVVRASGAPGGNLA